MLCEQCYIDMDNAISFWMIFKVKIEIRVSIKGKVLEIEYTNSIEGKVIYTPAQKKKISRRVYNSLQWICLSLTKT